MRPDVHTALLRMPHPFIAWMQARGAPARLGALALAWLVSPLHDILGDSHRLFGLLGVEDRVGLVRSGLCLASVGLVCRVQAACLALHHQGPWPGYAAGGWEFAILELAPVVVMAGLAF